MRWKVGGCGKGVGENTSMREERQGMELGRGEAIGVRATVCGENSCDIVEGKGVLSRSMEGGGANDGGERKCVTEEEPTKDHMKTPQEELKASEELEEELRLWAAYRGQTLTRTEEKRRSSNSSSRSNRRRLEDEERWRSAWRMSQCAIVSWRYEVRD
ncbi:hypothetical protein BHE74_00032966 [Ensete ventricosum]|nr:hypothetical protein BHE74_00032966 [Ensete ventricosum]